MKEEYNLSISSHIDPSLIGLILCLIHETGDSDL
jgi:hypothetical protein